MSTTVSLQKNYRMRNMEDIPPTYINCLNLLCPIWLAIFLATVLASNSPWFRFRSSTRCFCPFRSHITGPGPRKKVVLPVAVVLLFSFSWGVKGEENTDSNHSILGGECGDLYATRYLGSHGGNSYLGGTGSGQRKSFPIPEQYASYFSGWCFQIFFESLHRNFGKTFIHVDLRIYFNWVTKNTA